MEQLLQNPVIQGAIIVFIVASLNALTAWIKANTKAEIVDKYWCYLQPIVDGAMDAVHTAARNQATSDNVYKQIVASGVVKWVDDFRKFEGKDPTDRQISAVRTELQNTVKTLTGA